jgi:hypothetical protein
MRHALSISAIARPARRWQVDPVVLALVALAIVITLEAAAFVYAAPMLDPTAPIYVT